MELDDVDSVAEPVVRTQARAVAMGVERERVQLTTGQRAITCDPIRMGIATFAGERLAQGDVVLPEVSRRELRRLVFDRVGLELRHGGGSGYDAPILAQSAHACVAEEHVADAIRGCSRSVSTGSERSADRARAPGQTKGSSPKSGEGPS